MNNYNFLEKFLHKVVLSPQIIREVTFDIENSIFKHDYFKHDYFKQNHIFIAGLARSGTTILLNSIYKSDIFASLTYEDMPFILAPNLWSKISLKKSKISFRERAHGDGINFSIKSPEAFEEVFWKTFDDNDPEIIKNFQMFVNNILFKYKKQRYLSKNNQNIRRIDVISKIFKNAKILIAYRDPIQHAYSLLMQHKKFIQFAHRDKFIYTYMDLIGHTEFGPCYKPIYDKDLIFNNHLEINHWVEQWYKTYRNCLENLKNKNNIHFVNYEKLCQEKEYWVNILNILEIKKPYKFNFKESRKDISLIVDKKINDKAYNLYSKLIHKNINL